VNSILQLCILTSLSEKLFDGVQIEDLAMLKTFRVMNNEPRVLGGSDFLVDITYTPLSVRNRLLSKAASLHIK